jgi:low affinity Fe/Cu permease
MATVLAGAAYRQASHLPARSPKRVAKFRDRPAVQRLIRRMRTALQSGELVMKHRNCAKAASGQLGHVVTAECRKDIMTTLIRQALTRLGVFMSHPAAFFLVLCFGCLWWAIDRESFGWGGGATLATLFMTLFIQRAEHRDTQAIHAKLDELLRAVSRARNELAHVDEAEPEEIEEHRSQELKLRESPSREDAFPH